MPLYLSIISSRQAINPVGKAPNLFGKRQLRPRKDAHRYVRVFGCCESSSASTKIVRGDVFWFVRHAVNVTTSNSETTH
jgi:hypothetical protein